VIAIARRVTTVLAALVAAGVLAQIYLIASFLFGADTIDAHKSLGFIVHGFELLTLIAALLARWERGLAIALAAIGSAQVSFAYADEYIGGLHGLFALVVFLLAAAIAWRGRIAAQS
jgi:hypothetical protein